MKNPPHVVSRAVHQIDPISEPGEEKSAILAILLEIRDELRNIRALLRPAPKSAASRLSDDDREILARLLPAMAGTFGSDIIQTKEILRDSALRELTAGRTPTELGSLCSRAVDQSIDGFTLQRMGAEHGAALWRVVRS